YIRPMTDEGATGDSGTRNWKSWDGRNGHSVQNFGGKRRSWLMSDGSPSVHAVPRGEHCDIGPISSRGAFAQLRGGSHDASSNRIFEGQHPRTGPQRPWTRGAAPRQAADRRGSSPHR